MSWRRQETEEDYDRLWAFARSMRQADRAGDTELAAEFRDEIEVIAINTRSSDVRQRAEAALAHVSPTGDTVSAAILFLPAHGRPTDAKKCNVSNGS